MTNAEYMEYEGYGLIEAALYSYTASADGSDLFSLAESRPGAGPSEGFLWDYILFRLYLAEKHILRFPSGFGCMTSMAEGLREGLSHLSLTLSTLSTLRSLNGSFLVVGSGRLPDRNHVERRFSDFRRMEKEASHSIENMIAAIASLSGEKVDGHMISLFSEETRAFLSLVSGKLSSLTPCHIYRRARSFTPSLPVGGGGGVSLLPGFSHGTGGELSGDAYVNSMKRLLKRGKQEYNENIENNRKHGFVMESVLLLWKEVF